MGAPQRPGARGEAPGRIERGTIARLAPWVAAVAVAVALLLLGGTPVEVVARFAAYWVAWIAVPGVLVWRVFAPRWQRPFDVVVVGVCVGYALELVTFLAAALA